MKRCPECRRDYYDDSLLYCLDDGTALLEGPASLEPKTAVMLSGDQPGPGETSHQIHASLDGPSSVDRMAETAVTKHLTAETVSARDRRGVGKFVAVIIAVGLVLAAGGGLYWYLKGGSGAQHFKNVKLVRTTTEGNVENATLSPDAKYIAYVTVDGASYTLWTRHMATNSRVQIAAPANVTYLWAAAFTADGNYVFYAAKDQGRPAYDLYQVPVLGGPPKKVLSNVSMPISLDREGRRLAFVRVDPASSESSIFTASADGTGEHLVKQWKLPEVMGSSVAWSPDGNTLASPYTGSDGESTIGFINAADGSISFPIHKKFNGVWNLRWLPDGSGLVFIAQEQAAEICKLWHVSLPGGEPRVLTSDLTSYSGSSLDITADAESLLAVQYKSTSSVSTSPMTDPRSPRRTSTRAGENDGEWGLSWDRSGRLFSVSEEGVKAEIWMLEPNTENTKLVMEESVMDTLNVTPDGRYLIFISKRGGNWAVWRTDIDGGNPKQLTTNGIIPSPGESVSPDGKWVLFTDSLGDNVYRVPVEGGEQSVFIKTPPAYMAQISPDGARVAYATPDDQNRYRVFVLNLTGDATVPDKTLELPPTCTGQFRWTSDSRAIVYLDTVGRTSNLWQLPLDGGKAKQITDFKSETIKNFAFSLDGKQLALARGPVTSDAVTISTEH